MIVITMTHTITAAIVAAPMSTPDPIMTVIYAACMCFMSENL